MKLLVIHGPNLNMLGKREPEHYGSATLSSINDSVTALGKELSFEIECFQSNSEAEMIEHIQKAPQAGFSGIIINPAAFGHTSIALRDAMLIAGLPFIEVHISNTFARESFRHKSYLADLASGIIIGCGAAGYGLALRALAEVLTKRH